MVTWKKRKKVSQMKQIIGAVVLRNFNSISSLRLKMLSSSILKTGEREEEREKERGRGREGEKLANTHTLSHCYVYTSTLIALRLYINALSNSAKHINSPSLTCALWHTYASQNSYSNALSLSPKYTLTISLANNNTQSYLQTHTYTYTDTQTRISPSLPFVTVSKWVFWF